MIRNIGKLIAAAARAAGLEGGGGGKFLEIGGTARQRIPSRSWGTRQKKRRLLERRLGRKVPR